MVEIKEIDETEKKRAFELHNRYLFDNRSYESWFHEYESYLPDKYVFVVATDNNDIVATQGMIPIYLNINGQAVLTGKSENTLIDPRFRKKIMFGKFYGYAMKIAKDKGMEIVWGLTVLGDLWKKVLRFKVYDRAYERSVAIVSLPSALADMNYFTFRKRAKRSKKLAYTVALIPAIIGFKTFSTFRRLFRKTKTDPKKYQIFDDLLNPNDIINLYDDLRRDHPDLIHIHQTYEYFQWRIKNNPNIQYATLFAYENNKLVAYAYLSLKPNRKSSYLTDFTFKDVAAGQFLLNNMFTIKKKKGVSFLTYYGNSHNPLIQNVQSLLLKNGFIGYNTPSKFVFKQLTQTIDPDALDIHNWYVNGLWSEGYMI